MTESEVLTRNEVLCEVSRKLAALYEDGHPKPELRFARWLRFEVSKSLGEVERLSVDSR